MDDYIFSALNEIYELLVLIQHGFIENNPETTEQMDQGLSTLENILYNMKGVEQ